jgi:hypothetical protein
VEAEGGSGLEDLEGANRILWVHVLGGHEPSRLVGADGQKGDIHGWVAGCNPLKVPPAAKARVAREI